MKISYVKASGSAYKNQHAIAIITKTSNVLDNSLAKASSNQIISASKPS